jgi:hypothetical protein
MVDPQILSPGIHRLQVRDRWVAVRPVGPAHPGGDVCSGSDGGVVSAGQGPVRL